MSDHAQRAAAVADVLTGRRSRDQVAADHGVKERTVQRWERRYRSSELVRVRISGADAIDCRFGPMGEATINITPRS